MSIHVVSTTPAVMVKFDLVNTGRIHSYPLFPPTGTRHQLKQTQIGSEPEKVGSQLHPKESFFSPPQRKSLYHQWVCHQFGEEAERSNKEHLEKRYIRRISAKSGQKLAGNRCQLDTAVVTLTFLLKTGGNAGTKDREPGLCWWKQ